MPIHLFISPFPTFDWTAECQSGISYEGQEWNEELYLIIYIGSSNKMFEYLQLVSEYLRQLVQHYFGTFQGKESTDSIWIVSSSSHAEI